MSMETVTPNNIELDGDDTGARLVPNEDSGSASNVKPKKKQKKTGNTETSRTSNTSEVWDYFIDLGYYPVEGKSKAECKSCHKVYVAGKSQYGTSSITRHVNRGPIL